MASVLNWVDAIFSWVLTAPCLRPNPIGEVLPPEVNIQVAKVFPDI